jgi:hypothetical protein
MFNGAMVEAGGHTGKHNGRKRRAKGIREAAVPGRIIDSL